MKDLVKSGDKRMTVKEVAEALGYKPDTIQGKVKELFPSLVKNGVATILSEVEVDIIKQNLVPRNLGLKSEVESATTEIEMKRKAAEVMAWLISESQRKDAVIAELEPRAECADALMRSKRTMSITDCSKYFGLNPRLVVFPYLRTMGYLTSKDLPTQAAIDAGYMVLKKTVCNDDVVRAQAMVLDSQLDTWRKRIVPQIAAWEAKKNNLA